MSSQGRDGRAMDLQQRTLEKARHRGHGWKLLESRPTNSKISVIEIDLDVGSSEQILAVQFWGV